MSRPQEPRLADYLRHVLDAIVRIQGYIEGIGETDFLEDKKSQDAVIRNFEVIGEASNRICSRFEDFAAQHPEVPWALAYEMRNALAHGYFRFDLRIVWKTIQQDLPPLKGQIERLLAEHHPHFPPENG